ncbi:hypothetical protein B0H15DRAFT_800823 [Mycena belliarum]|uniref:F-box domain-containing protein n=1 Tax=Mycena belliarum TaxID=1033014 RepID=A0AAD6U8U2_9AGAR|nr:hypothetical protein B0H15DRAFT_800823 [Mycena belliae]
MPVPSDEQVLDWLHDLELITLPRLRTLAADREPRWIISEKRLRKLRSMGKANAAILSPGKATCRDDLLLSMVMRVISGLDGKDGLSVILNFQAGSEVTLLGTLYESNADTLSWYYEVYALGNDPATAKNTIVLSIFAQEIYGPVLLVKNGPTTGLLQDNKIGPLFNALLFPTGGLGPVVVAVPGGDNFYMPWLNPQPDFANVNHHRVTMSLTVSGSGQDRERTMTVLYNEQADSTHPYNACVARIAGISHWKGNVLVLIWDGVSANPGQFEPDDEAAATDCVTGNFYDFYSEEAAKYKCTICADTLYQPVLFCFGCLLRWLKSGHAVCPHCTEPVKEAPIRDNAFEMALADAIGEGTVNKAAIQLGKSVATGLADYAWHGVKFPAIAAPVLYKLVLEDDDVAHKIMAYCRGMGRSTVRSSSGGIFVLPVELLRHILHASGYRARTRLAQTCRAFCDLSSSLVFHDLVVLFAEKGLNFHETRLMLLGTHTLLGGFTIPRILRSASGTTRKPLEFYLTREDAAGVRAFLTTTSGFVVKRTAHAEKYTIYHMRRGALTVKVVLCPGSPMSGVLLHQFTIAQGFCDGAAVHHPYPRLLAKGHCLTTPRMFPIEDDLSFHVRTWKTIRDGLRYGFHWVSEFDEVHICGEAPSCPATFRHTRDEGWSTLRLPAGPLGSTVALGKLCWSLYGTGCIKGTLRGGEPCPPPLYKGKVHDMASVHKYILDAYVNFLDAAKDPLYHSKPGLTYTWEVCKAETARAVRMGINPAETDPATPIIFTVFGVVRSLSRQLEGFFDNDEILLTTSSTARLAVGTVVFATAHLVTERDHGQLQREEYYCLNALGWNMTSPFRPFMLKAMRDFIRASPHALGTGVKYGWAAVDGRWRPLRKRHNAGVAHVLVFGLVRDATEGHITLVHPRWTGDGPIGRELGLEFDKQLLEISRILEERSPGIHWNEESIELRTECDYVVAENAVIVVNAVLSVGMGQGGGYWLEVESFETVFVDRA